MKIKNLAFFIALPLLACLACAGASVKENNNPNHVLVDPSKVVAQIDDLTYGANQTLIPEIKFRRVGGNRMTGYNWETNASNAGRDWKNISDMYLRVCSRSR